MITDSKSKLDRDTLSMLYLFGSHEAHSYLDKRSATDILQPDQLQESLLAGSQASAKKDRKTKKKKKEKKTKTKRLFVRSYYWLFRRVRVCC